MEKNTDDKKPDEIIKDEEKFGFPKIKDSIYYTIISEARKREIKASMVD